MSIRTDLGGKLWNEIGCPECKAFMEWTDIEQYADNETFAK